MTVQVLNNTNEFYAQIMESARTNKTARKDSLTRENAQRLDSVSPKQGLALSRMLEHIYKDMIKQDYPDNDALEMFYIDRSVPAGAKTHTVQRLQTTGQPKVHRGRADDIPVVNLGADEEEYKVLYYVIGAEWDHFEKLSAQYANTAQIKESLLTARDSMMEFWNHKTWHGDEQTNLPGVLNNPYVNKMVLNGVEFKYGGDAVAMLSALQRLVNFARQNTKGIGALRPNLVIVSTRLKLILESTYFNGVEGPTVLSRLESTTGVKVEESHELQASGPGGSDQIFVCRKKDRNSVANVTPMGFTQLPIERNGFIYTIPCFMAHGGVVMRKPLMNTMGYATVED